MDWTEKARELVKVTEKNVGHCCGDVLNLYADDLEGVLLAFASEVERLTLERAAEKQLIAIEYLINQEVAFHEQKQHRSVDFKAGFMLGLKQVRDHLLPIAKEESVAVASSQGGE